MIKNSKRPGRVTPLMLLNGGKVWHELYNHSAGSKDNLKQMAGLYCLCVAVEFYMKAYIVLRDASYADPKKLLTLSHSFRKMLAEVQRIGTPVTALMVEQPILRYNFLDTNMNEIKYPESPRMWQIDLELLNGKHDFELFFSEVDSQVQHNMRAWLTANPTTS
jgi:hypothetical protein